jgi:hypothetical protein
MPVIIPAGALRVGDRVLAARHGSDARGHPRDRGRPAWVISRTWTASPSRSAIAPGTWPSGQRGPMGGMT